MDQHQALAERLKQANNILVTVSNNPSVDQLAACIGLTLALNKMDKHATAVFSGNVPSTIEFLQPEKTIEKNTDSLRDFIISLDKSKADKLRYKVEDKVVKIFITPYRTSINEKDFEFSQGDFNVDVVLALGVHSQAELDQAITSHGRILHDATVTTVNVKPGGELGTINWVEPKGSSLSELVVVLIDAINKQVVDNQIATALLTGIVAETQRFSNDKTSPTTMTISAELMSAGANQQLVSTKLEPPKPAPAPATPQATPIVAQQPTQQLGSQVKPQALQAATKPVQPEQGPNDGTIEISHLYDEPKITEEPPEPEKPQVPQIKIDEQGAFYNAHNMPPAESPKPQEVQPENTNPNQNLGAPRMILEPPANGGQLTANTVPEDELERPAGAPEPSPSSSAGILERGSSMADEIPHAAPGAMPAASFPTQPFAPAGSVSSPPQAAVLPEPTAAMPPAPGQTLNDIEQGIHSPHLGVQPTQVMAPMPSLASAPDTTGYDDAAEKARNEALHAIDTSPNSGSATPIQSLNAAPLGQPLHSFQGTDASAASLPPLPESRPMLGGATPPPPGPPPMMPPPPAL